MFLFVVKGEKKSHIFINARDRNFIILQLKYVLKSYGISKRSTAQNEKTNKILERLQIIVIFTQISSSYYQLLWLHNDSHFIGAFPHVEQIRKSIKRVFR